ncbi:MAG: SGNH/GDSL hydrolase family protein [Nodularia sp. (in: cyanobacteria)]|nr:SGNH/GDSL hydrolase family protein [Nodularia sp. (in: cyanobacteria)]
MLAVILLIWQQQRLKAVFGNPLSPDSVRQTQAVTLDLGTRHQLDYQQWLNILKQEAQVASDQPPERLSILTGDSLSLWFPPQLLPEDRNWLNQAISGESSDGLLKRLDLFDRTQPEVIFVMIGINDLIRGVSDQVILNNQRRIMTYLRKTHPQAQIVVQSILPHGDEAATWEGREKLLKIPNSRIRQLNQQLQNTATKVGVKYLDLYPLFTNQQGNLHSEFTTDGLHLNPTGYVVWRTALQMYSNMEVGSGE